MNAETQLAVSAAQAADEPIEWTERHHRSLLHAFARLRRLLEAPEAEVPDVSDGEAPIDQIVAAFGLSAFERDVLLLAAGIEMDPGLAERMPRLSFAQAIASLPDAHWSAASPMGPLRTWRLVEPEGNGPQARLRIDERVLHHLAGLNELDARLVPLLRVHPEPSLIEPGHATQAERVAGELAASQQPLGIVVLAGDDRPGQRDTAALAAARLGRALCVLDESDIPGDATEQEALATLWQREAVLLPAALLIETADDASHEGAHASQLRRFAQRLSGPVFVATRETAPVEPLSGARIDRPNTDGQRRLWLRALGERATPPVRAAVDAAASQFRLSAAQIAQRAQALAVSADPQAIAQRLWRDCCEQARPRLDELAQRVEPVAGWDDLVLADGQVDVLHRIAAQVRQRIRVYGEWGFASQGSRGLGISALFFGESGVGKTMACEVLARELGLDLYRIDLSNVVSKYIGETEKNLRRVFDAAEDSGAILLFDEADALFGKRSEVKDSHDRYANIEVGYLLQRMEAYRGLAVLTTNHRSALDPAFSRRLRFVLQFPFPDVSQRETIWRRVFPKDMPRADLDYGKLARLQMTGGHIRNIALNAAFLAAEAEEPVRMGHLALAAQLEAAKQERAAVSDVHTRGWETTS